MRAFLIKEMFQAIKIPSYNNLSKVIPMGSPYNPIKRHGFSQ